MTDGGPGNSEGSGCDECTVSVIIPSLDEQENLSALLPLISTHFEIVVVEGEIWKEQRISSRGYDRMRE